MSKFYRRTTKFDRRGYISYGVNSIWQIDLIDLSSRNAGYILNCIDTYTRKAESVKLSSKNVESVKKGFQELFVKFGTKPQKIQSDKEGAILSLEKWLKSENVELYQVENSYDGMYSAPIVERLNRTMKDFMYDLKDKNKQQNWNQLSNQTVNSFPTFYNNKIHRSIKTTPNQAYNKDINIKDITFENYNKTRNEPKEQLFLGDFVRVALPKQTIERKLEEKYTKEAYEVIEVLNTNPTTYKLKDLDGSYYKQQLIKVEKPEQKPKQVKVKKEIKQQPLLDVYNKKENRIRKAVEFLTYT